MKSSKTLLPIVATFLTTSMFFILFYFFFLSNGNTLSIGNTSVSIGKKGTEVSVGSQGNTVAFKNNTDYTWESGRITWEQAKNFKSQYTNFRPLQVLHKSATGRGQEVEESLQGFVFESEHLREIIDNNRSGTNPDKIIFYFGQKGIAGGTGGSLHGIINIIAVGVQGKTLLIDDASKSGKASIYDQADPCPPFCPEEPAF